MQQKMECFAEREPIFARESQWVKELASEVEGVIPRHHLSD